MPSTGPATSRRGFLRHTLAVSAGCALARLAQADEPAAPSVPDVDVMIRRAAVFRVPYRRPRLVAGNSTYRVAGDSRSDTLLALFAGNDQVGIGPVARGGKPLDNAALEPLVGRKLNDLLGRDRQHTGSTWGTTAFWDLAGKSTGKPVYELLGGRENPQGVPVYDGSIYMEELIDRDGGVHKPSGPNWETIIRQALDSSVAHGHNFVKLKIGRGAKHLSRRAGNLQDVAVIELVRKHLGPREGIGVDANNGYTPEFTRWLLDETAGLNIAFVEEMFPENVAEYRSLKDFIRQRKLPTLVADGENWRAADEARPFVEASVIDVLQGDMVQFQFEGILAEAALGRASGAVVAPHNWGSEFGFYMQCQLGQVIPNFYRAECDPGQQVGNLLVKHGYEVEDGRCRVPTHPGLGVELNVKALADADVIASAG
jgi:L-alanine-DL-glutamate epimerase-like enolase superfamily enzyme